MLEEGGFSISGEAADGSSGLAEAQSRRPDLVLLDVRLPDMSGLDVARALLRLPLPPIVILTSTADAADYHFVATQVGVRGFIAKTELTAVRLAELLEAPS
jgi:DNA-binding NarL/FixJ family response regulator